MKEQRGYILLLTLLILTVGTLVIVPFLRHAQAGLNAARISDKRNAERYAADAGIEDAIWRVQVNKDGFTDSVTPDNSSISYSITVNGIEVFITVELPQVPEPEPLPQRRTGQHLNLRKLANKNWIQPSVVNTLVYTIELYNYGTNAMHIDEMGDIIPMSFTYVPGSSSGITTDDPTITWDNNRQVLTWYFTGDKPKLASGETRVQTFEASVTPPPGIYYDEAWAVYDPASVGKVATGPTAPVAVAIYEITSQAGRVTVQAAASISSTEVNIMSWQQI
ncbi:MAG: hypothetical protein ISS53_01135 [Dehalococcoidia bacterium]|nr:hypothetical protein [Dehalococcoidia bacterium]